jgi:predicted GNAT superfamily acetyltransferase
MKEATIRDYAPTDADAVLALNQAHVPEVGPLDMAKLRHLVSEADWVAVVEAEGEVHGFAIFMVEQADYASTNYGWFAEQHPRFYYVDRIAIGEGARGMGVGQRLYRAAADRARSTERPVLCAEVNTIPINEASLRFHQRFGFEEKVRRCPYGDEQEVAMLELALGGR